MAAVNVRDVAALAGVSLGTVSNALNRPDRVSPSTLRRVHDAIDKLGFVRNDAARQLRAGRSRSIGLLVLDIGNPFFTDLAEGAEDRASEAGFAMLLGNSHGSAARETAHLALFEEQRVRGMLISPVAEIWPQVTRLRTRDIPTVLVDRAISDTSFSSVSVDDVAGGALAVEHLLSIGRRKIAFVGGPTKIRQVADRLEGASRALNSVPGATLEVLGTRALTVLEGRRIGELITARAPGARPDAVFAANDLLAVGVLQGLTMVSNLRVPDDIALIGYDDIAFASATVVPLTSIRQPSTLIGRTAVELLLAESENSADYEPQQVVFAPELVVRDSTALVVAEPVLAG
ncbi:MULTISPECIES: LacI family DNA-binding transcriptional regulator [Subtercola]|uniref:LacI family transcriptional regulator n=1 Tax=Subtercola vilae TaxID=2056433 RepID=A0A4T2BS47_9MICO|nr:MULTISPECIES: LacI family DNA-binding transcriptional regulator [Subtercola]MEA9986461.1 LacI family DNA-binding transcriptional regulator [Subtercola sp. RTI3]TIH34307.1 LacI family transcriptional regulator [Subtercola vilae]